VHDKNAGLAVVLGLLVLCAVLATGCATERRGAAPGPEPPLISPPDIPEPPPATVAVPGSEDPPAPPTRETSITGTP
jgi:hypothetical protein